MSRLLSDERESTSAARRRIPVPSLGRFWHLSKVATSGLITGLVLAIILLQIGVSNMRKKILLPSHIVVDHSTFLQVLRPKDAPTLFGIVDRNRERLSEWLEWVSKTNSVADSLSFIESSLEDIANNKAFPYGIWYKDKLVGVAGTISWNLDDRMTEIGAWIDTNYEGKGIITNVFNSFIEIVFTRTNVTTIQALVEPSNVKSNALINRLGFSMVDKTYKTDSRGRRLFNIYKLTRKDWRHT